MAGFGFYGGQGLGVKFHGAFESLQRQALGRETVNGNEARALAQGTPEAFPGFLAELGVHAECVISQIGPARFEWGLQMGADWTRSGGKLLNPPSTNLTCRQWARPTREFARVF